jgi:hypothetical protein
MNEWMIFRSQSQSHVTTDGQSVSQSGSMSWCRVHSGTCGQKLFSAWKLRCCVWGVLYDERSGLSLVSHYQQYFAHCQHLIQFKFYMFYVYTIYTRPLAASAQYNRSCPIICIVFRVQDQGILRPTLSRPVCLGVWPPVGPMTRF